VGAHVERGPDVSVARELRASNAYDSGARLCGHDHRVHYLGGGLWVCFACWAKALIGGRRRGPR
jgi:hypothetical protein